MDTTTITTENAAESQGLTQRAALLMMANVIATAISFALPPVLTRVMSVPDYGLYKQAFQIMASALALLNLQVAVSVFYYSAREPAKKLQVALNVILFYGLVGATIFLVFLVWPTWVTLIFHGSDLVPHIPLLGFAILCSLVSTNLDAVPIAAGEVGKASVLIVLSQLSKAIVMIVAGLVFGSLTAILVASVIQSLVQIAFMVIYIRGHYGRFFVALDWPLFKAQIGNALPFGVGGIVAIVQNDMHNYFVSHYFDSANFAVYAVGCFQLPLLGMLTGSFANALNPDLAKHKEAGDHQAIINLWMEVICKLAFFFVPTFAVLFVLRHEFITVLYTANYAASAPIFAIYLVNMLLGIAMHMHILRLFEQLKFFRLKLYMALIPVTLGALYLGLQAGGLLGVAIAAVCVQILDFIITMTMIVRELGVSRRDLWQLVPVLKIATAAAAAALITLVVRYALRPAHAPLIFIVCATVYGLSYMGMAFALGAVSEAEKADLRKLWQKFFRNRLARARATSATEC